MGKNLGKQLVATYLLLLGCYFHTGMKDSAQEHSAGTLRGGEMLGSTPQEMINAAPDKWRKNLVSFDGKVRQIDYLNKKLADVSFDNEYVHKEALTTFLTALPKRFILIKM